MKRLIMISMIILCLLPAGVWAEETFTEEMRCTKNGVEDFITAYAATCPNGILSGVQDDAEHCFNVTPARVAEQTDIRIFKFSSSGRSYAMVEGKVYDLCESWGGYGFLNAVPWDYDSDGRMDLLVASSWGSGYQHAEISVFNRAKNKSTVIFTTLNEPDPQIDLTVEMETQADSSSPEVILRKVKVLHPDGDFAHLTCRNLGLYQPAGSFVTHMPYWDEESAIPLVGDWYCSTEENGIPIGMSLSFFHNGLLNVREIEPGSQQYTEGTVRYRLDDSHILMETPYEISACRFTVADDELRLFLPGQEPLVFTRLTEEERAWWDTLQPKYQPGDAAHASVDYGSSARFTKEQMDAAITAVREYFTGFSCCELHSIAYTSDEESLNEYRYYAGPQSRKTGKNYVEGMVFISSFHTPPEEEEYPGSGLNPDEEYTGWSWVLLLSDGGEWEVVTYGY